MSWRAVGKPTVRQQQASGSFASTESRPRPDRPDPASSERFRVTAAAAAHQSRSSPHGGHAHGATRPRPRRVAGDSGHPRTQPGNVDPGLCPHVAGIPASGLGRCRATISLILIGTSTACGRRRPPRNSGGVVGRNPLGRNPLGCRRPDRRAPAGAPQNRARQRAVAHRVRGARRAPLRAAGLRSDVSAPSPRS